jgi:hypothetical protein
LLELAHDQDNDHGDKDNENDKRGERKHPCYHHKSRCHGEYSAKDNEENYAFQFQSLSHLFFLFYFFHSAIIPDTGTAHAPGNY